MLTSGHVFAGCGGDSLGAKFAEFTPIWAIENDKYAAAVYRHNFPEVNLIEKDIREMEDEEIKALGKPSIIIAGSPCQDFSLSGSRKGLTGTKSKLFFEFCRVLRIIEPQSFLWENVTGILCSNGGEDFKKIIREFAKLGYVGSWGTSAGNAAQSRKRIICVGINRQAIAETLARRNVK